MRQSIVIIILFSATYCKNQKLPNEITIEGNVKNFPDGKVYLTEAHRWQIPLYSTQIKNGHFIFKLNPDSSFVPYMAAIHFPDSTRGSGVGSFFYRNHTIIPDSTKYSLEAFILERGRTRIEGDYKSKERLRVFAGKETDVMYKNQFTDFGWLGNIDSARRSKRIAFFRKEINKYPFSYFLLQSIFDAKEQYSKAEMRALLALFYEYVQTSSLGDEVRNYLAIRPDPGQPDPNLSLLDSNNQRHNIIDTGAKLNMLVFWASWCGPCRKEIPTLKDIYSKYKGKELSLVNISIDLEKEKWKKALTEENMKWPEYIVDSSELEKVQQQFNFAAIPLIVFTDRYGNEIKRFLGNQPNEKDLYLKLINDVLSKK